jgi:hypothetical protein
MAALGLIGEQVAILRQQVMHQFGIVDDGWHAALLSTPAPRPDAFILPPLASPA